MARRTKLSITEDFSEALKKYAHLRAYVKKITATVGEPEYHLSLDRALKFQDYPNIIYPVGDPMFVHIYKERGVVGKQNVAISNIFSNKMILSKEEYEIMKYFLLRDRVGYSKLEPMFNDPYLEDIH